MDSSKIETGFLTVVQRFGSALNLNIHFHTLAIDGVFIKDQNGKIKFTPQEKFSNADVETVLNQAQRKMIGTKIRKVGSFGGANEKAAITGTINNSYSSPTGGGNTGSCVDNTSQTGTNACKNVSCSSYSQHLCGLSVCCKWSKAGNAT